MKNLIGFLSTLFQPICFSFQGEIIFLLQLLKLQSYVSNTNLVKAFVT